MQAYKEGYKGGQQLLKKEGAAFKSTLVLKDTRAIHHTLYEIGLIFEKR